MTSVIPRTSRSFGWKTWVVGTVLLVGMTGAASWAHPGRTDAQGCHTCRTNCAKWGLKSGEYHCHNARRSSPPATPPPMSASSSNRPAKNAPSLVRLSIPIRQVLDGDTLVASIDGRQRLLHLYDVDAPELEQPFGEKAKKYTSAYFLDESAEIAVISSRASGGLWVRVSIGGQDLAKLLLDAGLAWCRPEAEDDKLKKREDVARKAKIGLWGQEQPEAPWTWRRAHGEA